MIINLENHKVLMHEDDYRKIMQYKTENEKLERENKSLEERKQHWLGNFKRVRDSKMGLIDENAHLKAENEALKSSENSLWRSSREFERENEKLRKQYTTITDHIRTKAENNPGVSRYIDLVNYIDRLERVDDER